MTLLDCISDLLDRVLAVKPFTPETFFKDMSSDVMEKTTFLEEKMGITPVQAVLFAAILQNSSNARCPYEELAAYLGMSYIKLLKYMPDIDALTDKWLVRRKGSEVYVPHEVTEQISRNIPYQKPETTNLSTRAIIRRMGQLFKLRRRDLLTSEQITTEMDDIMFNNQNTSMGSTFKKYFVSDNSFLYLENERYLFYLLSHLYERGMTEVEWGTIEDYFDDKMLEKLQDHYKEETLRMQCEGIVVYGAKDGVIDKDSFRIADSIMEEVFADEGGLWKAIPFACDMEPKDIVSKELFYNDSEREQVNTLTNLLSQENLNRVYTRLKDGGMRTGFTCLFYGSPGTGKTETVYQLARKTGRKIIIADVSKLKNCYVGETEKSVRRLFRDYRWACRSDEPTPILLFNEADAIFGVRMQNATKAVDKMENSVQNIILQEMESMEGILIATTNLTENLDPAFERRFLYKIKFDRPSLSAKTQIWKSMIPEMTDDEAGTLAREYEFSGGQIENIVRKRTIQSVLFGTEPDFEKIKSFCAEERINETRNHYCRIGY